MSTLTWQALDLFKSGGWMQGTLERGTKHCIVGLYARVHNHDMHVNTGNAIDGCAECQAALTGVVGIVKAQFPDRYRYLERDTCPCGACGSGTAAQQCIRFNDHPATVEADVELVLHKAAIQSDEILSN